MATKRQNKAAKSAKAKSPKKSAKRVTVKASDSGSTLPSIGYTGGSFSSVSAALKFAGMSVSEVRQLAGDTGVTVRQATVMVVALADGQQRATAQAIEDGKDENVKYGALLSDVGDVALSVGMTTYHSLMQAPGATKESVKGKSQVDVVVKALQAMSKGSARNVAFTDRYGAKRSAGLAWRFGLVRNDSKNKRGVNAAFGL